MKFYHSIRGSLNIFKRRRQIERIKALSKFFNYSRADDIAKVFELCRIEALHKLRLEVYAVIIVAITISGIFIVPRYIDSIVDSRVEKEIEKRIDGFKKFFHESNEIIPFSVLAIRASNDDRIAFDDLIAVSKSPSHTYHRLAEEVVLNITANINPSVVIHLIDPQNSETDISKLDKINLDDTYKKTQRIYRVNFLTGIGLNKNISQREKLDFAAAVIRDDDSLRAVEAARQTLEEEVKIGGDVRDVAKYIEWWKQNRERY